MFGLYHILEPGFLSHGLVWNHVWGCKVGGGVVEKGGARESRGWPKCDDHLGPKEEFSLYFSLCLINTERTNHPSTQVAGMH